MIEGENYHALKALQIANVKVDIIYIDPPYNTGNEFIYNDNYVTENKIVGKDDPHKHSKWLSFMKRRLELAQQLLNDDGIIFISIDDNEQAYLKVLMDEIFGEENFISSLVWDKKNAQNDNKTIEKNHEYILMYSKNINFFKINITHEQNKNKGKTYSLTIGASGGGLLINRKNLGWTLYFNPLTNDKIPKMDYDPDYVMDNSTIESLYVNDNDLIKKGYIPIRPPFKKNLFSGEHGILIKLNPI